MQSAVLVGAIRFVREVTTYMEQGFGIIGVGGYLPRLRLDRAAVAAAHRWMAPGLKSNAKGTRSMINWDEDVLTMAVEAGRSVLGRFPVGSVGNLTLASTTLPFADRLNASVLAAALGLDAQLSSMDAAGSLRCGSSALLRALRGDSGATSLIVASERRIPTPASTGELLAGDGAAAIAVGHGEPLAVLRGSASETIDFVDHFRASGRDGDYGWEERWVREEGFLKLVPPVIRRALAEAGLQADQVDAFLMPAALMKVNQVVAKKAGIRPEAVADTLFETCGDTGAAHPLLMLARELESAPAGRKIVLVQFGSGCDVIVLETVGQGRAATPAPWLTPGRVESNYFKYLSFTNQLALEWGMRAEMDNKTALSAAWRGEEMVNRFAGGKCSACGTVQFPKSRVCVNPECTAVDTQQSHVLLDEAAKVRSFTCDWLSYKPCPPFLFGHVEFASGARVMMEFTDCEPDELAVGVPLRMVFRIKDADSQRGFKRYFWKATVLPQDKEN